MMTDQELLAIYVKTHSESAFRTLVTRYIDIVYAAALRQLRDSATAEDVTQAVFIILARRAAAIRDARTLPAWLLKVATYCAIDARRSASRRKKNEQGAAAMLGVYAHQDTSAEKEQLAATLDMALAGLPPADHTAIIQRFFLGQSFTDVAQSLDISEEAAKKRVSRALQKLRKIFQKMDISLSVGFLATAIERQVTSAPTSLLEKTCAAATAPHAVGAAGSIAKGALKLMAWSPTKITAVAAATIFVIITTVTVFQKMQSTQPSQLRPLLAAALPATAPSPIIEVRDAATHQPLGEVRIELSPGWRAGPSTFATTNASGIAAPLLPATINDELDIIAVKDGFVHLQMEWVRNFPTDNLPTKFTMDMEKSTTVGGRVVDQDGNAIPNALIMVNFHKHYSLAADILAWNLPTTSFVPWDLTTTTDANGQWTLNNAPDQFDSADVGACHPMYLSNIFSGSCFSLDPVTSARLHDRSGTIRLRRGTLVQGVVLGPDSKPVKAFIGIGDQRTAGNAIPEIPTDDRGRFQFAGKKGRPITINIRAENCAAVSQNITPSDPSPLQISLHAAAPIRVCVVNDDDQPVPNAVVHIDGGFDVTLVTDNDGCAAWTQAPLQDCLAVISAQGYLSKQETKLQTGATTQITLIRQALIRGLVIDAQTRAPIKDFRIVEGFRDSNDNRISWFDIPNWSRLHVRRHDDGTFELSDTTQRKQIFIRASGNEYLPTDSNAIVQDGEDDQITIAMKKGKRLAGQLLDQNGRPLANLKIRILTTQLDVYDAQLPVTEFDQQYDPDSFSTTDENGNFSFPPQLGNYTLLAQTADGYVLAKQNNLGLHPILRLTPFAKVTGLLTLDGKPAPAGTSIQGMCDQAALQDDIGPYCHFSTKTDAAGHFEFPKVFAGLFQIYGPASQTVEAKSGQVVKISLTANAQSQ